MTETFQTLGSVVRSIAAKLKAAHDQELTGAHGAADGREKAATNTAAELVAGRQPIDQKSGAIARGESDSAPRPAHIGGQADAVAVRGAPRKGNVIQFVGAVADTGEFRHSAPLAGSPVFIFARAVRPSQTRLRTVADNGRPSARAMFCNRSKSVLCM